MNQESPKEVSECCGAKIYQSERNWPMCSKCGKTCYVAPEKVKENPPEPSLDSLVEAKMKEFFEKFPTKAMSVDGLINFFVVGRRKEIEKWLTSAFHTIEEKGYERGKKEGYEEDNGNAYEQGKRDGEEQGYEKAVVEIQSLSQMVDFDRAQEMIKIIKKISIEQTRKEDIAAVEKRLDIAKAEYELEGEERDLMEKIYPGFREQAFQKIQTYKDALASLHKQD